MGEYFKKAFEGEGNEKEDNTETINNVQDVKEPPREEEIDNTINLKTIRLQLELL